MRTTLTIPWILLLGLSAFAVRAEATSLPMVRASAIRTLDEADRVGLRPGEPIEVQAVAELICEIHEARPRCGGFCNSTRADRSDIPDYADTIVEEVDCWDTARVLVAGSEQYEVPLDEILATAYQESTFRELAIGSGTECGIFQQSTTWIRWSSADFPHWARMPFDDPQDTCRYLLNMENAMFHFAVKYHHERRQSGRSWSAYYNGGPNMWAYHRRHEALRVRFGRYVDSYVSQASAG